MTKNQHCVGQRFCAVRQQAITWVNVNSYLFISPYGITQPQWVKEPIYTNTHKLFEYNGIVSFSAVDVSNAIIHRPNTRSTFHCCYRLRQYCQIANRDHLHHMHGLFYHEPHAISYPTRLIGTCTWHIVYHIALGYSLNGWEWHLIHVQCLHAKLFFKTILDYCLFDR